MSGSPNTTTIPWITRALESLWLLVVLLVPLVFLGRNYGEWSSVIGSFELPKIVLLRTLVALMAALWLVEWALQGRPLSPTVFKPFRVIAPGLYLTAGVKIVKLWLHGEPARWVRLAVLLYLGSVVLSTVLSASFSVSMWGDVPGQDSYSAYTVATYLLLFAVMVTHLKTVSQLQRLLGAVAVMGVLVALYGVLQHYDYDFIGLMEPPSGSRVTSTMGNSLFAGSLLLMTVSASLVAATISLRGPLGGRRFWWKSGLWASALAVQIMGLIFTLNRGPWFGAAPALVGFLVLTAVFVDRRCLVRASLVLASAVLLAVAVVLAPSPTLGEGTPVAPTSTADEVTARFTDIGRQLSGGGPAGRIRIWKGSLRLMVEHPWFGFDDLTLSSLRPLIGYGPDMFRYTYLLESPPAARRLPHEAAHAHNFTLHQGVEAGILGLATSLGIAVSLLVVGGYQLIKRRRQYSEVRKLLLAGLLALFAGRWLEQLVGVARVSDLTLYWALLAALVAVLALDGSPATQGDSSRRAPATLLAVSGRPRSLLQSLSKWRRFWVLPAIAGLIVGLGLLTWGKSINYLRAGLTADQAAAEYRVGDLPGALSSLDRAIALAPDVSTYYELRSVASHSYLEEIRAAKESVSNARPAAAPCEVCLAEESYRSASTWVLQRPFYYRSRLTKAEAALTLGSLEKNGALIDESIQYFQQSAQMVPHSWLLLNRIAAVYAELERPEEALATLSSSLAISGDDENSFNALRLRAQIYRDLKRGEEAIASLNEAIRLSPLPHDAYFERGTILAELGRHREAVEDFDKAIEIDPRFGEYFFGRGTAHYNLGLHQRAVTDLTEAIARDPGLALAYNNRGLAYAGLGRTNRAIKDFDEAIRLDPKFALAYNNRGFVRRDQGQLELSVADLDKAIELNPLLAMAYLNRALARKLSGREAEARLDTEEALSLGLDPALVAEALAKLQGRH